MPKIILNSQYLSYGRAITDKGKLSVLSREGVEGGVNTTS